ncbi:Hypothetical protein CINCED_3A002264 [Cinara cedri]|uniref:Reverse transcriptase domain n=1 Tax=Cinara cedri TaxID=506608 RepID=A0A5E4M3P2_9HEMI|nr:Hypothetical protein CINCED_3A002264 [Cinara cedri]
MEETSSSLLEERVKLENLNQEHDELPQVKQIIKFERDEIKSQTQEMLLADIFEPPNSQYSFPNCLVAKGLPQSTHKIDTSTQYRWVLDYRKLNNITIK